MDLDAGGRDSPPVPLSLPRAWVPASARVGTEATGGNETTISPPRHLLPVQYYTIERQKLEEIVLYVIMTDLLVVGHGQNPLRRRLGSALFEL